MPFVHASNIQMFVTVVMELSDHDCSSSDFMHKKVGVKKRYNRVV